MEQSKLTRKCHICKEEFSHYNFRAHFLKCDQNHDCEKCGKIFQTVNLLKNHKSVHEGHRDHKCESCSKSFTSAADLKRHIHTIHEGHKDQKY